MNRAPHFPSYPVAAPPVYARWWGSALALLAGLGGASALLRPFIDPGPAALVIAAVLVLWAWVFMLRVLRYRLSLHYGQCYAATAQQLQDAWWSRHRQTVALRESVLVSLAGHTRQDHYRLFDPACQPPVPTSMPVEPTLRLPHIFGDSVAQREFVLAQQLAMHWGQQRPLLEAVQPAACFWHGSPEAWQAFSDAMAVHCPQVTLPATARVWAGGDSLNVIIDALQDAPAGSRILCAGCHSTPPRASSRLPAGEAAVLWLFAAQGSVRFSRGEWFCPDNDELAAVAQRVLEQHAREHPANHCIAFSQPDAPRLPTTWTASLLQLDAHFGDLGRLQTMVAQTLAAWHAEKYAAPCAWLASDPNHPLTLGIMETDESSL